jgi:hypothetical protein
MFGRRRISRSRTPATLKVKMRVRLSLAAAIGDLGARDLNDLQR